MPALSPEARRNLAPKLVLSVAIGLFVLLAVLFGTGRYGVLTPQALLLIEARTDGLKIGRLGRLKIEGLSGDLWRDARVRKLSIRDENGVWLEAYDIRLEWRYLQLIRRRFDADVVEAKRVRLIRRPTLEPKGKDRGLPVSFQIDRLQARIEMEPAFSYERGVYDLNGQLSIERAGGREAKLRAISVLHPGDHLNVDFAGGKGQLLRLVADGEEARGGALAGALGLSPDRPFKLAARVDGTTSAGKFAATVQSGAETPLWARGAWNPAGGEAGGQVRLAASRLTTPYAERFGDTVRFGIAGRKTSAGTYALEGRFHAPKVTLRASGLGDLGKRTVGPEGVALVADAADLSEVLGGPQTGAVHATGRFTKAGADWKVAGDASVRDAALWGYVLGRADGPVEVIHRADGLWTIKGDLTGRGGAGKGYVAAIMGGAPKGRFEIERPSAGGWAFREIVVKGRGLDVQATGGRTLLGAMTFKGKASVSNLAEARIGAGGGAKIDWSALRAGRPEAPWTFTMDARGEKFASGLPELDRLLGAAPRIEAQANWRDGALSVAKATLTGTAIKATAAGTMNRQRALAFKADWSATGPFRAGPVEIAGQAKGTGAVTGPLATPRLDLIAELESVDVPRLPLKNARVTLSFVRKADGSSGMVSATADSKHGPARGRADFRFPQGGVDLTDLSLDAGGVKAEGAVSLRSRGASSADLRLAVGPGALLDVGEVKGTVRIVEAPDGPRADIDLTVQNARPTKWKAVVRSGRIAADGPLAKLPYSVAAEGSSTRGGWILTGQGVLTDTRPDHAVTLEAVGRLGGRDLRTTEPAVFRFGGADQSAKLRMASSDGGRIEFDSVFGQQRAKVDAKVTGLTLGLLDTDLAGRIDATLALQGQGSALSGTVDARLMDARGLGAPVAQGLDATVRARLGDSVLTLDANAANEQGLKASANVVLPAETSASPFRVAIARRKAMRGRFFAEGEARPLWDLLFGGERTLAGFVHTEGSIGGTLSDPEANGRISVERGRFDDGASGLSLREVTVRADFADSAVNVTEAKGVDGKGGSVFGAGRVSLERNGVSNLKLNLAGFRLIDNELATASASGQATVARTADGKVKLAGELTIDRADVAAEPPTPSGVVAMDVIEVNRPPALDAGLPAVRRRGSGWQVDVTLKAPRRIFLRGRGLDVELSLDAHVGGTTSNPTLSGAARVVRGDYEFAGKRFEFDERSVVYLGSRPEAIRLQLDAVREDPTLTVTVRIRGTAARPEIALASQPSLPNDEILSQVLFGRSASQLSPIEAAQLASALSSLAGGGGLDVIGNLRSFAGLDRLAFAGGEETGVSVSGGKYLTDDVYLELTGGGREGPSAQVEWRVRRTLSIISKLTGQGDNRLAIRWRRDY